MAVDFGLWRIDGKTTRIEFGSIDEEKRLQTILAEHIELIDPNLLIIGREVSTPWGMRLDILALDGDGHLVVLELKRGRTPREVVAQVLEYGAFVRNLRTDEIVRIFNAYQEKYQPDKVGASLDEIFEDKHHFDLPEDLNDEHHLIIVATELDPNSERIVDYLADVDLNINVVFFRVFNDDFREYLARAWMRDPAKSGHRKETDQTRFEWNNEYYVSFGADKRRDWNEAIKYGFISAGGGPWYSRTLSMLQLHERFWVNIPGKGYTGVGIVAGVATPIGAFRVQDETGNEVLYKDLSEYGKHMSEVATSLEDAEYYVKVEWLHTVPISKAVKEKGFFGNQNTVARPRSEKWEHTVKRLKFKFGIGD